jgi:alkanesulfonate monooxygenase SsuD/methylene tetrahydromethanopterin reductase-like flavin-dependent oxidoreductase (luciferase family)
MSESDSFEFSCVTIPSPDPTALADLAILAESTGYDRYWVPDQEYDADPFLLLHDLANQTAMNLGLAVTNPFSRHPVQIARAWATLIHLDRRNKVQRDWVLALGMGNVNLVHRPLGFADAASSRRLVAAFGLIRALMAGEQVTPADDGFLVEPVSLGIDPAPCRLFLGTRGPKTLAQGAPHADGILAEGLFTPTLIDWTKTQAGLAVPSPHVCWQSVILLEADEPIPDSARDFTAMVIRTTAPTVLQLMGVSEHARNCARENRLTVADVADDDVRCFVACGTVDQLIGIVTAAMDAGATGWGSVFLGDDAQIAGTMQRFAQEVIAPIRRSSC